MNAKLEAALEALLEWAFRVAWLGGVAGLIWLAAFHRADHPRLAPFVVLALLGRSGIDSVRRYRALERADAATAKRNMQKWIQFMIDTHRGGTPAHPLELRPEERVKDN